MAAAILALGPTECEALFKLFLEREENTASWMQNDCLWLFRAVEGVSKLFSAAMLSVFV